MLAYTIRKLKYYLPGLSYLTFSMRHENDNCDLTIQAVVTCWVVDVAHKLRKCYSSISQIR